MNDLKALLVENCEANPKSGPMSDMVQTLGADGTLQIQVQSSSNLDPNTQ